jgi:hypothetical protein
MGTNTLRVGTWQNRKYILNGKQDLSPFCEAGASHLLGGLLAPWAWLPSDGLLQRRCSSLRRATRRSLALTSPAASGSATTSAQLMGVRTLLQVIAYERMEAQTEFDTMLSRMDTNDDGLLSLAEIDAIEDDWLTECAARARTEHAR